MEKTLSGFPEKTGLLLNSVLPEIILQMAQEVFINCLKITEALVRLIWRWREKARILILFLARTRFLSLFMPEVCLKEKISLRILMCIVQVRKVRSLSLMSWKWILLLKMIWALYVPEKIKRTLKLIYIFLIMAIRLFRSEMLLRKWRKVKKLEEMLDLLRFIAVTFWLLVRILCLKLCLETQRKKQGELELMNSPAIVRGIQTLTL